MNLARSLACLVLSAGLHLALFAALPDPLPPPVGHARDEGGGGIEVGLALAGAEAAAPAAAHPSTEEVARPEPIAEEARAEPAPERAAREPTATARATRPRPAPAPPPEPAPLPPPPAPATAQLAERAPAPPAPAGGHGGESKAPKKPAAAAASPGTSAGGGREAAGGGERGDARSYFAALMAHLHRHKRYPVELKKRKVQGAVTLEFTIRRDGAVSAARVRQSSGHPDLDRAALAMLEAAAPLPPLPHDLRRDAITVVIPVEFSLITDTPLPLEE